MTCPTSAAGINGCMKQGGRARKAALRTTEWYVELRLACLSSLSTVYDRDDLCQLGCLAHDFERGIVADPQEDMGPSVKTIKELVCSVTGKMRAVVNVRRVEVVRPCVKNYVPDGHPTCVLSHSGTLVARVSEPLEVRVTSCKERVQDAPLLKQQHGELCHKLNVEVYSAGMAGAYWQRGDSQGAGTAPNQAGNGAVHALTSQSRTVVNSKSTSSS